MIKRRKILSVFIAAAIAFGSINAPYMAYANSIHTVSKISKIADKITASNYPMISNISEKTILGADFSNYQQDLIWGKTYKDYKNKDISNTLFDFVKSQGVNTISVKVSTDDKSTISLENAIKTLKEAQKSGLKTNMVLLYSDEMTYGNKQDLPKSWSNEKDITTKAVNYTKDVLEKLSQAGINLDILTIGNEVNYNFLGYAEESAYKGWEAMAEIAKLVQKQGIKVSVSISEQKSPEDIKWVLQKLNKDYLDVDFDYVGVNIYPTDNTLSYIKDMRKAFEEEEKASGKKAQFYISGVKYVRQDDKGSASVFSQANNIYKVLESGVSENNTGGLIYTDAENVGAWTSFFDESGKAVQSLSIFALAKGENVDNNVEEEEKDPYEYGGESGLKEQEVTIKRINGLSSDSIRGVDISSYTALKKAGVKYYNFNGEEESLIKILADNGVNYLRIRVWNDPYNEKGETYGGGACDVESGLEIAREAAKYNMKLLVDLHYSDFWADPGAQIVPKAWKADENNPEAMAKHVYDYTKEVIEQFKETGIEIGMVQVGNEITPGILGISTSHGTNVENSKIVNKYLSKGCQAVREVYPDALIALHLEGQNVNTYRTIMNSWERDNVDYDILGTSHYAYWGNSSYSLEGVLKLAQEYGKFVTVLETGWLSATEDADGTPNIISEDSVGKAYSVGVQGQVDMLTDLYETLSKYDNGLGAFYWEPAWIPVKSGWTNWEYNKQVADIYGTGWASGGAVGYYPDSKLYYNGNPCWGGTSWDNQTLFDMNGHALQSLKFYKAASKEDISSAKVSNIIDKYYTGKGRIQDLVVNVNGKVLEKDKDYTVKYTNNKSVGTATVTITGKGNYTGTIKKEFKIKAKSISSATVSNIKDKSYTGKEQTQDVIVNVSGKVLEKNKDYTVKYTNNKSIGTATVTITGKGNYTGTIKKTFKIKITKSSTYTIDTMKYKITNAKTDGTGTVELVSGPSNSKKSTITVANTVKIGGKTFRVTSIGSKAFRKNAYIKKVVLGKYITNIGQESFYGCNQLKTIEIKSTSLKSVGKNAFAKIYKKAYIKVPSSKLKTYKNLFKKSTGWQSGYTLKK